MSLPGFFYAQFSCWRSKGGEFMGRPRKMKSVKALEEAWTEYKHFCDNQTVLTHEFNGKHGNFVTAELTRAITYTIEGFCMYVGLSRSAFYSTYGEDEKYSDMVTRMREECEVDARRKFELQMIPSQLAGLWMSKHGYTTKADNSTEVKTTVQIVDDMDG